MAIEGRTVFGSRAFAVGVAQAVVWLVLGAALLKIGPQFERIFKDFNTPLPAITIVVLKVTHLLASYWYLGFAPVLLWPFVNWGVVSLLSPRPEIVLPKRLWYFITWLLPFVILVVAVVGLMGPLMTIIPNLSK